MEEVGDLKRLPLLPWQLKYVGVFLLLMAVGVYIFIHLGKKPQWLEWECFLHSIHNTYQRRFCSHKE